VQDPVASAATKTHIACPLCGSPLSGKYVGVIDRLGTSTGTYAVDQCTSCGLGITNPAPTGDLSAFYPDSYLSQEDQAAAGAGILSRLERIYRYNQYAFDFGLLERFSGVSIADVSSYIDIGCGSGERVTYAARRGCSRPVGIDRFTFAKHDPHQRVELIDTAIQDYVPDERFDVASMFHVLEHLEDPVEALAHTRAAILRPDGFVIAQVPNYASWERKAFGRRWFGLDAPRHLFHFGPDTVRTLFERAGYELIGLVQQNAALHPVTFVPSMFPALDVQRIWVGPGSGAGKMFRQALWGVATIASIPLALVQNLMHSASMLTVVARPRNLG
jgi:SAM-dependent methyltransferase